MNFKVDENTLIGEILDYDFDVAPFFIEMGMHCLGCPSARGESIAEACLVHGIEPSELIEKLNNYFMNK